MLAWEEAIVGLEVEVEEECLGAEVGILGEARGEVELKLDLLRRLGRCGRTMVGARESSIPAVPGTPNLSTSIAGIGLRE